MNGTKTISSKYASVAILALALGISLVASTVLADGKQGENKESTAQASKPGAKAVATTKRVIDPTKITWLNFADGLKYARAEKKHVLLDFTASWCGWCKKMDAEAFSDTAVVHYINANFIPVKVWADSEEKLDIDGYLVPQSAISKDMFQVGSFPTFHYLRPSDQKMVRGRPGYRDAISMLEELKYVNEERYVSNKPAQQPPAETDNGKGK